MPVTDCMQVIKTVTIAASASNTVDFECASPYRNMTMFVSGTVGTATAQPLFGGINDGSSTALVGTVAKKIFQAAVGEIRPPTSGLPDGIIPIKSSLKITNSGASTFTVTVFMAAAISSG